MMDSDFIMETCMLTILFFTGISSQLVPAYRDYELIEQAKNWNDAQAYCRANFDDLATVQTNNDFVKLFNLAQTKQFSSMAWIGLYTDISGWHWSLGNESLGSVTQWYRSLPDNEDYECTVLDYKTGWWDMYCTNTYPFACFDDSYTGNSRYIVINSLASWYDARSYCRQYHTDLASARNSTENSIILQLIRGAIGYSWIGLHREPWKWSDNTNISPMPWIPGKPDDALGNETCGYIYNGATGDAQCSDIMPFYCQKDVYLKKQQTIKVKVQSNQDANDPVVKEAILEQIKQKVQEYGMAGNTTFHWREQPDGNVFHKER